MPSDLNIQPNVRYRIQNVDFKTCLERRDDTNVVVRPQKDVLEQQWVFVANSDGTYSVVNAQKSLGLDSSLDGSEAVFGQGHKVICTTLTSATGKSWRLARDEVRPDDIYFVNADLGPGGKSLLLSGLPHEPTFKEVDTIQDFTRIYQGYETRWKLVEDSATLLPYGNNDYIIRTLPGHSVHSRPGTDSLFVSEQFSGDQRRWQFESRGNGVWTIKNIKEDAFLIPHKTTDDEWVPILAKASSDADKNWNIHNLGPVNYIFWVDRTVGNSRDPIRFALSLKENNLNVVLRPNKLSHNQIWHIDLSNGPEPDAPRQILPGLMEGEYQLQNLSASRFLVNLGTSVVNSINNQGVYFKFEIAEGGSLGPDRVNISYLDDRGVRQYWSPEYVQAVGAYHVFLVGGQQPVWVVKAVEGSNPPQFRIALSQELSNVVMIDLRPTYQDRPYAFNETYNLGNPNWLFIGK
ncbi:hypothetical protein CPB84DRAFT_1795066 [Gymnopilus junonius]|uniref:Ricin B lectin domain-containing protein n=1 Tax=Gymnopilus junonius TaxID=109634 RepID=A0A9P5TGA4_GYMJU|nr:hypothetical protein CPB84DRAFT_1795066 [Gymnopilus junonius]